VAKIIEIADNHSRDEPHFVKATSAFYRWFIAQEDLNVPENTFIDGGDHWHRSRPSPTEYALFYEEFERHLKFRRKIALRGNHDRATPSEGTSGRETNSIDPLEAHGFELIKQGKILRIGQLTCIMLPYQHDYEILDCSVEPNIIRPASKDEYYKLIMEGDLRSLDMDKTSLTQGVSYFQKNKTFVFYHFPDETQPTFGKSRGVDLSAFSAKGWRLIGADIHLQSDRYIGPPRPTRADEAGQRGRIAIIDDQTGEVEYRACPMFLDFVHVKYGEKVIENPEGETLIIVEDAPSTDAAKEAYGESNVWDVRLEVFEEDDDRSVDVEDTSNLSFEQHRRDFYQERHVDDDVKNLVEEALIAGDA
jgi:hypothetical protein